MLQQVLEMFPPPVRLAFGEVDRCLDAYTQAAEGFPERLREAMRYSLLAPGKRLRPLLVLAACDACGGEPEQALPAACAVEMIHTYSLIHDDLPAMDDDELRRGRPTCHIQFDEATAILAGDALIPLAFEVLATGLEPADLARRAVCELARAAGATQLVGGQADDLQNQFAAPDREMLEAIHLRKTAAMMAVLTAEINAHTTVIIPVIIAVVIIIAIASAVVAVVAVIIAAINTVVIAVVAASSSPPT